jgi:hypothetical protein
MFEQETLFCRIRKWFTFDGKIIFMSTVNNISKSIDGYLQSLSGREKSSNFLAWFLINYFAIDEDLALEYVCDSINDKGIDGIYVDDTTEDIYIFQVKFAENTDKTQGDKDLRNFCGATQWFKDVKSVENLLFSSASEELKSLVRRLNIETAIAEEYNVNLIFVSNLKFDQNSAEFLFNISNFEGYDITRLESEFIYASEEDAPIDNVEISLHNGKYIKGNLSEGNLYYIIPYKVRDLITLKGIKDKSLFSRNVRYGLGKTRVNKDITNTLENKEEHEKVFLYHNGITLICDTISNDKDNKITVSNYSIVNGCQSTITFFENKNLLTDNLEVLLKIIETKSQKELSKKITYSTNNQNTITIRDLKSNNTFQRKLQKEFDEIFNKKIFYQIKRGETSKGYSLTIPNDFAAQLINAFHLKAPYFSHEKTKLFNDHFNEIFSSKINATYIYLLYEMFESISNNLDKIKNQNLRTYKPTRYLLLYVFRLILEQDEIGKELVENPKEFYKKNQTKNYRLIFEILYSKIIIDFNYLVDEKTKDSFFDYKNELRNITKSTDMAKQLLREYEKNIGRHSEDQFSEIFKKN